MPNDSIREQLIAVADLAREVKEHRAAFEAKEEQFKQAFSDFFDRNREYVFANALFEEGEDNPPFRYHDLSKRSIYSSPGTRLDPNRMRMTITCSCGSREDSCDECGDGMFSYFTVNENAQILRLRAVK